LKRFVDDTLALLVVTEFGVALRVRESQVKVGEIRLTVRGKSFLKG